MDIRILQALWSYRITLVATTLISFAILSAAVFLVPATFVLKSAVEIGWAPVNETQTLLEPVAQLSKRVSELYVPKAVLSLQATESTSTLRLLTNTKIETPGSSLVLTGLTTEAGRNSAVAFQNSVIEQILESHRQYAQAARDAFTRTIGTWKGGVDEMNEAADSISSKMDALLAEKSRLEKSIETSHAQQKNLAQQKQGRSSVLVSDARNLQDQAVKYEILRDQADEKLAQFALDLAERRRSSYLLTKLIEKTKNIRQSIVETRVTLAPTLIPVPIGLPRTFWLTGAAIVSMLFGFALVAMLQRLSLRVRALTQRADATDH